VARGWATSDWVALLTVTTAAAALRLIGLGQPAGLVFDEIFYAQNACVFVQGATACGLEGLVSRAHPPLGNWLIGIGIALFGYHEVGWRLTSALAGLLGVAALFWLARHLLQSHVTSTRATAGAAATAGLLAVDPLHIVISRTAMLDSFVTLLTLAIIGCAVLDAEAAGSRATAVHGWHRLTLGRPWRLAAGVAIGVALGVKWSAAYAALGAVALLVLAETSARRGAGIGWWAGFRRAFASEWLPSIVLLGVVPGIVYMLGYVGTTDGAIVALPWREGSWWRTIAEHQVAMLRFHLGLEGHHPYESPPWSWLALKRPVAFWFDAAGDRYREVLAIGNPLAWWGGAIGLAAVVVQRARDPRLVVVARVALVGVVACYGPWLLLSGGRSQVFIWYVLPALPFLYLAVGALVAVVQARVAQVALGLAGAGVLAVSAYFWPILSASPLTPAEWRQRMWFTDCARPGAPTVELPDDTSSEGPPPLGWCWI